MWSSYDIAGKAKDNLEILDWARSAGSEQRNASITLSPSFQSSLKTVNHAFQRRDDMYKLLSFISLLLLPVSPVLAQQPVLESVSSKSGGTSVLVSQDVEGEATKARAQAEKLYRQVDQDAKRAIRSMCVECMGVRYNRPGPKTPLILQDEVLNMEVEPQLETEP